MDRLKGKRLVVTGAGSGIGRASAILFAREGARVVVADQLAGEHGEETVRAVRETGGDAVFVKADVSRARDVQEIVEVAISSWGGLDAYVNCAAISPTEGSILEVPEEDFDRTVAVNLKGTWFGMKYAIPHMLDGKGGSIVNFASVVAARACVGIPVYSATKAGVIAMSRVAALEYADRGVRVNCIAPGLIATPLLLGAWDEDSLKTLANTVPQNRLGQPEEVAQLGLFLASDESSHITGQTVFIDGGMEADSHIHGTRADTTD